MGVIFGEALMISIDHTVTSFKRLSNSSVAFPARQSVLQHGARRLEPPGVGWIMDYGGGECWAYTNELNGAGLGGLGWLFERAVRALRDNSLEIASEIMM